MATVEYLTAMQAALSDPSWDYEHEAGSRNATGGWYVWTEYEDLPRGPYRTKEEAQQVAAVWTQAEYERRKARED